MKLKTLFRTKSISHDAESSGLRRCLTAWDLTLMGIGAIIGAGIFVLTGIAAATQAGPAIVVSYILAGVACALSALSYAELASSIGGCGSAYGYAYAGLGEFIAWIIGWVLLLEYGMACSTISIGWSGYVNNTLSAMGIHIPRALLIDPFSGGVINLPAALLIGGLAWLLSVGVKESARFNKIVVFIKLAAIAFFIAIAAFHVNPANWHPFAPFGWHGIVGGAALIFFAYIGFDAVSTAAEETIEPRRALPIGIILSLAICTVIYVVVAGLLTGISYYPTLNVSSPVAEALVRLGFHFAGAIVAIGAIAGLTTTTLVMYFGFTRIFLAMARDGLLPKALSHIHPKSQTPRRLIISVGVIMALVAGFTPINGVAQLVNIGTLAAFVVVCAGVVVMRYTQPDLPRTFRTPGSPIIPTLGAVLCIYLMSGLSRITWISFLIWLVAGLVIYFSYSRFRSVLGNNPVKVESLS
ncbi:MAG: amino acid permease [Gammaproteobacteria bacterium]